MGGNVRCPHKAIAPARFARGVSIRAQASPAKQIKKVVLAYSGGLDTSIILKWLTDTYGCEVVTFTADLGQVGPASPPPTQFRLLATGFHAVCAIRCLTPVSFIMCAYVLEY